MCPQIGDQCGKQFRIEAAAGGAEVVRGGVPRRHQHQIALGVSGDDRPDVGGAGGVIRAGLSGPEPALRRYRIPGPAQLARAHIEGAHDAGGRIDPNIIGHQGTDDDHVANDEGGRGRVVLPGSGLPHPRA